MSVKLFNVCLLIGWLMILAGGVLVHPGWGVAIAGAVLFVGTGVAAYVFGFERPKTQGDDGGNSGAA